MVVHRNETKKQSVKTKRKLFFYEKAFLHELTILRIASNVLQKKQNKEMKKRNLKIKNYIFYEKSFRHKIIPKIVSMLAHRKDTKKL